MAGPNGFTSQIQPQPAEPVWAQQVEPQPMTPPVYAAPQQTYVPEQQAYPQQESYPPFQQQPFAAQSMPFSQGGPLPNQPGSPFEGYPNNSQPPQPSTRMPNISYMNGLVVDKTGKGYRHAMRVAQITTVPDCYRLVEFMRGSETVLVNLDTMNDAEEMGRCLDLLYGAAYALQCTFTRVSNKSLYLITPADILVQPYDSIGSMTDREIDQRWPDPASVGYRQRNPDPREQQFAYQQTGFAPAYQGYAGGMTGYADYGRLQGRAVNQSQNTGYTDFGGFGGFRR